MGTSKSAGAFGLHGRAGCNGLCEEVDRINAGENAERNYYAVDMLKLVFSLGVIMLHHGFPLAYRYGFWAHQLFARLGVPFFFVCSGFFLGLKANGGERHQAIAKYIKKLMPVYLCGSLLYMAFYFAVNRNFTIAGLLQNLVAIMKGESYSVMWFAGSLILSAVILAHVRTQKALGNSLAVAFVMYVIGLSFNMYSFVFVGTPFQSAIDYLAATFSNSRVIFVGYLFVAIGYWIAAHKRFIHKRILGSLPKPACLFAVSLLLLALEIYAVRKLNPPTSGYFGEFYLFHILAVPSLFLLAIRLDEHAAINKINKAVTHVIRKSSTYIYYWHVAFINGWGYLLKGVQLSNAMSYMIVAGSVLAFSAICSILMVEFGKTTSVSARQKA